MNRIARIAATACLLTLAAAHAQERVLTGPDVNEQALLDALTPLDPGVKTRGLVLGTHKSAAAPQARRRPSASLLITFATNSSDIAPAAREQLDVVAAALKNERLAPFNFQVEGHADPRGNPEFNLALSQRRAESVRRYLVGAHRIDADRLTAIGKGDREPLVPTVPAAPENRRVTIVTQLQVE